MQTTFPPTLRGSLGICPQLDQERGTYEKAGERCASPGPSLTLQWRESGPVFYKGLPLFPGLACHALTVNMLSSLLDLPD
jgi:hypothetical protein